MDEMENGKGRARRAALADRPDARSMMSQAKGTGVVGYNVQTAVDAKHHLIVITRSPTSAATGHS